MVAGMQILSSEIVVSQGVKFVTLQQGEIPYIGGPLGLLKVNEACQTRNRPNHPHFSKE